MSTEAKLWPTKDPQARAEWDFRPRWKGCDERKFTFQFLTPEQVALCCCYEFDRMNESEVDDVHIWRKTCPSQDFPKLLNHYWATDPNGKDGIPIVLNWFYKIWPQWPGEPFLSIPETVRRYQVEQQWPLEKRKPRCLTAVPLDDMLKAMAPDYSRSQKIQFSSSPPRLRTRLDERLEYDGQMFVQYRKDHHDGREYARVTTAFEIDFSLHPSVNGKLFENWCRKILKLKGWNPKPNKAGASAIEKMRAELNCLGALRLHRTGMTFPQARDFTAKMSGLPLYSDKSDWSKAVKRAQHLLEVYS